MIDFCFGFLAGVATAIVLIRFVVNFPSSGKECPKGLILPKPTLTTNVAKLAEVIRISKNT